MGLRRGRRILDEAQRVWSENVSQDGAEGLAADLAASADDGGDFELDEFVTADMITEAETLGVEVGDVWLRGVHGIDVLPPPMLEPGETITDEVAERLVAYYRPDVEREIAETIYVVKQTDDSLGDEDFQAVAFNAAQLMRFGVKGQPYTRGHCDASVGLGSVSWIENGSVTTRVILLDWETGEIF